MTEKNIVNSNSQTWVEVVMEHRKPVISDGRSKRYSRSTGTQMITFIKKKLELFSHTIDEIREFCLDYLGIEKWTKKIWRNCSFPQFLRKSGVCDYLILE